MGADDREGRDQRRHRPELRRADAELDAVRRRRPARPGVHALGVAHDPVAEARPGRRLDDLRAAHPRLLDDRRQGPGRPARQLPRLRRERRRPRAPQGARQGGPQHGPPAAELRHRLDRGGQGQAADAAVRPRLLRARQRPSSRSASAPWRARTRSTGATTPTTTAYRTGSYASSAKAADGGARVAEFRTMVGALHQDGLRVVLDQVFNHTAAVGPGRQVGARQGRARLLPAPQRDRRGRDLDVLPERRDRARDGREAHGRLRRVVGAQLPRRRLPLRPHGPPQQGEHARGPLGPRRPDAAEGRRRRQVDLPLRRGLELRRGRRQQALRPGDAGPARRHGHRHLLRPSA